MTWLDRFRAPPAPKVEDNRDRERFEIRVDGRRAGYSNYTRKPGLIDITHTEIEPEFEGRGLGSTLIRESLAIARAEGASVLPHCPFVREYISRHPAELDLVPAERRAQFDLPSG